MQAKMLKNLRYALLNNPEHLSENQRAQLQFLTNVNPKLYCAYLLKWYLRLALKAGPEEILVFLPNGCPGSNGAVSLCSETCTRKSNYRPYCL